MIVFEELGLNHVAEDSAFSCYGAEQLSQTSTVDCFQSSWTVAPLLTFHIFCASRQSFIKNKLSVLYVFWLRLMFILLTIFKLLEPSRRFIIKIGSDVRDFDVRDIFNGPTWSRTPEMGHSPWWLQQELRRRDFDVRDFDVRDIFNGPTWSRTPGIGHSPWWLQQQMWRRDFDVRDFDVRDIFNGPTWSRTPELGRPPWWLQQEMWRSSGLCCFVLAVLSALQRV